MEWLTIPLLLAIYCISPATSSLTSPPFCVVIYCVSRYFKRNFDQPSFLHQADDMRVLHITRVVSLLNFG